MVLMSWRGIQGRLDRSKNVTVDDRVDGGLSHASYTDGKGWLFGAVGTRGRSHAGTLSWSLKLQA